MGYLHDIVEHCAPTSKIDKSLTVDPNISYNIIQYIIEETKNTHLTIQLEIR